VASIENIVCFDKLTSLSLSNNRIQNVANLDHLKTLTALDLSFNRIASLPESLKALNELREFSLFSNELVDLKVIDEIKLLSVLNVGRNKIATLDALTPLRKLTQLRALNAAGNPVADKYGDDYEAHVLAYLGAQIKWLDYRVVDNEKTVACQEQFRNELELLASTEGTQKAEAEQAERDKANHLALQKIYMFEAATL